MELPQPQEDHGIHLNDEGHREEGENRYSLHLNVVKFDSELPAYSDTAPRGLPDGVWLTGEQCIFAVKILRLEIKAIDQLHGYLNDLVVAENSMANDTAADEN